MKFFTSDGKHTFGWCLYKSERLLLFREFGELYLIFFMRIFILLLMRFYILDIIHYELTFFYKSKIWYFCACFNIMFIFYFLCQRNVATILTQWRIFFFIFYFHWSQTNIFYNIHYGGWNYQFFNYYLLITNDQSHIINRKNIDWLF